MSWTPEQTAEIRQLFADGMTQTAIAARVSRTLKAVNMKLKRAGVDTKATACRNGHPWTDNAAFTARGKRYCRGCYRKRKSMKTEGADGTPTCRNGHPLTEDNIYIQEGATRCRTCRKEGSARWRATLSPERREARNASRRTGGKPTWRTDETLTLARSLWAQSVSAPQIAERIGNGCTARSVYRLSVIQKWPRPPRVVWDTVLARQLWDEGLSDEQIARRLGTTPDAISGYRRRRKWPSRYVVRGSWRGSDAQEAKVKELWETRFDIDLILRTVNAAGPKQYTTKKLRHVARRLGLKRPSLRGVKMARLNRPAKPPKQVGGPIPIPYREVRRLGADLELPLSKRGDIYAVSNAMKRAQPGHPGFVLADHQPTRLTWAR